MSINNNNLKKMNNEKGKFVNKVIIIYLILENKNEILLTILPIFSEFFQYSRQLLYIIYAKFSKKKNTVIVYVCFATKLFHKYVHISSNI